MSGGLEETLKRKFEELEEKARDFGADKDGWIEKVDKLYAKIEEWLEPLKGKYLEIKRETIPKHEELLGRYNINKLIIDFSTNGKVELIPKGLHIIGGKGRVDINLGLRTVMLVGMEDEPCWMFAERKGHGKPEKWDFTKDAFEELLREYVEGL